MGCAGFSFNEFAGTVPKFHRPFGWAPRRFPELMGSFSDQMLEFLLIQRLALFR